jgi:oligopeptide transport system ATP-binding protein
VSTPLLQVRNLTTKFGNGPGAVTAVNNVSFEVNAGETLAIVGESGSGKSVTALSVLRLVPDPPGRITDGEIVFDGVDLTKLSENEMRAIRGNRIAMIFQEPMTSLNPSLTIGLQIAEPINLHTRMPWAKAYDKAKELLDRVRMPDARSRLSSHPHQFSGGMRQRIMIAMALACQPKLIIADERETGSALILITHDLGVVARYADRVCVMYGGKVIETASAHDLYAKPMHPYTRGLMASIPRLDQPAGIRLVPIKGQPPNLAQLPTGCAFNPRCGEVVDRCRRDVPGLMKADDKHMHACWVAPHV